MGMAAFPMVLVALVYLGIVVFMIYLGIRFVRSIEGISESLKRIADKYEVR